MRYKKVVPVHIEERVVSTDTLCDGCGRQTDLGGPWEHNEVTMEARFGDVFPEGDHREAYDIDICKDCFLSKVVPALAVVGLRFRTRNIDDDDRVFGDTKTTKP